MLLDEVGSDGSEARLVLRVVCDEAGKFIDLSRRPHAAGQRVGRTARGAVDADYRLIQVFDDPDCAVGSHGHTDRGSARPRAVYAVPTGNQFLKGSGWNPALPAVMEVTVPGNFDWKPVDLDLSQWRRLGFSRADGEALPSAGAASLYLPEGANGPAFLITENWEVIRQYNLSDSYALSVALLAERIAGSAGLKRGWPKNFVNLGLSQRAQAQKALLAKGFYKGATDGKVGRATRVAVHDFQIAAGIVPADGFLTPDLLQRLQQW